MTATVRVSPPLPVNVNDFIMRTRTGIIRLPRYRTGRKAAGWMLAAQRPAKIAGTVNVQIDLVALDRRTAATKILR